jgi:hypothetical protein
VFAAQLVGIKNQFLILRESLVPILVSLLLGICAIMFAQHIGSFM